MISFEAAISKVLDNTTITSDNEMVSLWDSIGRILAVDIESDINMPPFDKSAVDGYACKREDLSKDLKVNEIIAAGQIPSMEVVSDTCSKIMTGAPVPKGADCVIMVEEVKQIAEDSIRFIGKETKTNIAKFAEDIREGDTVLWKGSKIFPQHIAILSSVGISQVCVAKKPTVSILITGDELVEHNQKPKSGQIRNSNGHQIYSQVLLAGAIPIYKGIIEDKEEITRIAIANALEQSNITVLTGGVSMGDYDFVPRILYELGVEIVFQTIAVQPGKPTLFGLQGNRLVFGLPGNPVSSLFQFELLVRPAIQKMMGVINPQKDTIKIPIASDYSRSRVERLALIPAFINHFGEVEPIRYHGSAHINALNKANVVILMPKGLSLLRKGEIVDVRPIQ